MNLDAIRKQTLAWVEQVKPVPEDDTWELLGYIPSAELDNIYSLLCVIEKRDPPEPSIEEQAKIEGIMAAARYRRENGQEPFSGGMPHSQPYKPRHIEYK